MLESLEDVVHGFPPFVRWNTATVEVNLWAPIRSGNETTDFLRGREHCEQALSFLNSLRRPDGYQSLVLPFMRGADPAAVLANIVRAMPTPSGPIELGFMEVLFDKFHVGILGTPKDTSEYEHLRTVCEAALAGALH